MKNYIKRLFKDEGGYGIVELILIVAGLGILSTAVMKNLQGGIAEGEDSTVNKAIGGINNMIDGWNTEGGRP